MLTRIAAALGTRTSVRIHGRVQYLARAERVPSDYLSLTGLYTAEAKSPASPPNRPAAGAASPGQSFSFILFLSSSTFYFPPLSLTQHTFLL